MSTATPTETARERRRRSQVELSRHQLLDAAEEVFGEQGFHGATLKEVADRAGFAVGSVYSFFESKDDLFRQLFVRRGAEFLDAMRDAIRGTADPFDQLHRLVDVQVGFFRAHPRFGRLYFRYSSPTMLSPERRADLAVGPEYDEAMAIEAAVFARGQAEGSMRDGDPAVLARLFSGMISAFHSTDPVVMTDDPVDEGFPLASLHDMISQAFRR